MVASNGPGRSYISIGSATIPLPHLYQEGARLSIGIPAGSIRVVPEQPVLDDRSMNCIPCQVKQVTLGKDSATVRLEGQIPLTAVMRRTCDDGNIPSQGMQVFAVIRDTDVRVLSGA
jgi:hypothetical protein